MALVIDDAGASYPLRVDPLAWTQEAELTASDGAANDEFGAVVAVSDGIAVVGAPYHQVGSNVDQGAAYVFSQNGSTWTQQAELTASDGAAGDELGASVSVSGGIAVVGAYTHDLTGAAYVFVQSGATWAQQAELTASDGAAGDRFGAVVAVSGGTAVVGAPYHQVGSNFRQGAAYVFVQGGTTWAQQAELTASNGGAQLLFGSRGVGERRHRRRRLPGQRRPRRRARTCSCKAAPPGPKRPSSPPATEWRRMGLATRCR